MEPDAEVMCHHPNILGGGWKLVRRLAPCEEHKWHRARDQLEGTEIYGKFINNPKCNSSFSIKWND